ncbi:uncharacterized protein LOC131940166 [Physella acuta]|uniref:uncharacterized protein LOC131940166 n=1 Tax=Physella acuta TaxID=109671 RepID=UPI0027DB46E3|nr:uncharacterized protein LOC131940166 [Physella acuta]
MNILMLTSYLLPLVLTSFIREATGDNISSSYPESFHTRQSSSGNRLMKTSYTYNILTTTWAKVAYIIYGFIPLTAVRFFEICNQTGDEVKPIASIWGPNKKAFTFYCNRCDEIPLDMFHGDQEMFIIEIEFLSNGVIKKMDILKLTSYLLPLFLRSFLQEATGENISSSYPESFHTRQSSSGNRLRKTSYTYNILSTTWVKTAYIINGFIPLAAVRFKIELCPESDCFPVIAFQFSVRMNTNLVVRNHKTDGKWASEETYGGMPFRRNANFNVTIQLTHTEYEVYVNRVFFCKYLYAFQPENVNFIKVHGDVQLKRIAASVDFKNLYLRRTIAVGDWVRFEMTPKSGIDPMFFEICNLTGNEYKCFASIWGPRQKNFTFYCSYCDEIPLDMFHGDQEMFIIEIEFLSDGVIKIYNDKRYLKTVTLELKHEIGLANIINLDSHNRMECFRIP